MCSSDLDTTAVALAAALGAEACEIYSDVDGVYSADPRVIADARRLDAMSHDEMLAMARSGAKVLGADAVAYARLHGIALFARATDGRAGETVVRVDLPSNRPWIVGVSARPHCALLHLDATVRGRLHALLSDAQVAPVASWQSADALHVLLGRDVADGVDPAFDRLLERVQADLASELRQLMRGTWVGIVGPAVGREPGLDVRFDAVVSAHVSAPLATIAHGATLGVLVAPDQVAGVLPALHAAFVQGAPWRTEPA